ncbi:DNA-directed RNA polymerase specialized sigma24 family protein [Streptomyces sp. 3211.6]|uniref:helix-turn-helix domain-containing protein n=1 Tax=Streptomyces sp. 3211.6 TaxID=1938845 RepID=UPI000EABAAB5|nr:helix-turn-helix domain-containing protein [Streptomyces sp. 3211.6]RKT06437.1 DNA-directed RNA polymerase specialized sigma24 family protein [Streptomyces sp. 3211.6]
MTPDVETGSGSERGLPPPKERRRLRESGELTHEQVATELGVSPGTVRSWETGRTEPGARTRAAYADLLDRLARAGANRSAGPNTRPGRAAKRAPKPPSTPPRPTTRPHFPTTPEPTAPEATAPVRDAPEPAAPVRDASVRDASAEPTAPEPAAAETPAPHPGPPLPAAVTPVPTAPPAPPAPAPGPPQPAPARAAADVPQPAADAPPDPATGGAASAGHGGTGPHPEPPARVPADTGPGADPGRPAPGRAGRVVRPRGPAEAFDSLYAYSAPALVRQVYLLTGRRSLAQESVERAFRQAWAQWPEVATDPDPVGWVRAAAYEYALSPWRRLRRAHRALGRPDKAPADPNDRILLGALLALPPAHRRTVLLYDGVGLDLPDTAAETEASTPTTGNRLLHAHADLAARLPGLAGVPPQEQSAVLREWLGAVRPAVPLEPPPAATVRTLSEYRARRWARAALVLTAVIAATTGYTTVTAPDHYVAPVPAGVSVSGVPPLSGPPRLTETSRVLQDKLRDHPAAGPRRIHPTLE